jgi:hypothetical protein
MVTMRPVQSFVLAAMAVMSVGAHATAQGTPNFSGTWVLSPESASKAGGTRPGTATAVGSSARARSSTAGEIGGSAFTCGVDCTITQTAKTLTIRRPANADGVTPPVVVLNLDGSGSKNQQAGRAGGPLTDYVAHAKWSGHTLVVTRALGEGGQIVTTQTLSIQGGKLAIAHSINLDVTLPTLVYTKK